jgi:hypothetical protein
MISHLAEIRFGGKAEVRQEGPIFHEPKKYGNSFLTQIKANCAAGDAYVDN